MDGGDMFELMLQKKQENEITAIMACNEKTEQLGLSLTREEAKDLVISRNESLRLIRGSNSMRVSLIN